MELFKNKNVERVISPPRRKVEPNPNPIIVPKKLPLPKEWDVPKPLINPTPKGRK